MLRKSKQLSKNTPQRLPMHRGYHHPVHAQSELLLGMTKPLKEIKSRLDGRFSRNRDGRQPQNSRGRPPLRLV